MFNNSTNYNLLKSSLALGTNKSNESNEPLQILCHNLLVTLYFSEHVSSLTCLVKYKMLSHRL